MTDTAIPPRPHYRWPKIALACVLLFLASCVLFMVKEARRIQRDRAADLDMRQSAPPTNVTSGSTRPR